MWATIPVEGTGALPPPGPTDPLGIRPVSSWYFGDGALQLNRFAALRLTGQIAALDSLLQRGFVERRPGGTVGFRVARALTRRLAAELTVDYNLGTLELTRESASGLEAARASFVTAWNGALTTGLVATRTVSSEATVSDHQGRQIVTAGTLLINVAPAGRLIPYVALGAGGVSNRGTGPSAVLAGAYQFTPGLTFGFPTQLPTFHQTDTVTIRSSTSGGFVWVLGGGVKYAMSERWGVRVDVRDHLRGNPVRTLVDTAPATPPTSFGVLALFAVPNPPLVFSGVSDIPSTLSGAPLAGFETFRGAGVEHQVNVTAGLFWRF